MKKMLTYDKEKRPSAEEILEDPWIKHNAANFIVEKKISQQVFDNIRNFSANQTIQNAALFYIVNQLTSNEEIKELKRLFIQLDENSDGKLSFDEIKQGFSKVYGEVGIDTAVESIFSSCSKSLDNYISYEEFIAASIDKTKIITENKLEAAFKLFDKNGDGCISSLELREILGRSSNKNDDSYWKEIVKEVDENGDGEISFDEFKHLMNKILLKKEQQKEIIKLKTIDEKPELSHQKTKEADRGGIA